MGQKGTPGLLEPPSISSSCSASEPWPGANAGGSCNSRGRVSGDIFHPPEWWQVLGAQEACEMVDAHGDGTGELVDIDAKPRKDGGYPIKLGGALVLEVGVDGAPVGLAETVQYALVWAEGRQ